MSMSVYRFNKDKSAKDATITFYYPLAAQKIWDSIWMPAISEMKCCLITDFGSFLPQQLENAIMELNNILEWSKKHCEIKEQDYMQHKIDNLKIRLETEAPNSDEPFYIF